MASRDARVLVRSSAQPGAALETAPPAVATEGPAAPPPVAGLTVGRADDSAEHDADRMADRALARLAPEGPHAHTPGCGHLRRSTVATPSATIGAEGGALDPESTTEIEAARGSGTPLPPAVRRRMEAGFGAGLGHVRVHDDPQAGRLSAAMSAEAFTTGSDIFFGAGRFAPETPDGEKVLAHEIAHVLTEPRSIRRLSNPFRKKTPEEKQAQAEKKRKEQERAAAVKKSKKTEKSELAGLKESRKKGEAGRAVLTESIYDTSGDTDVTVGGKVNDIGHVPMEQSGPQKRAMSLHAEFEQALEREKAVFEELKAKKLGGSDEKRAELAYQQVWYSEFPQLNAVRPPRETAAERLVIQVRQTRSEAEAGASAEEVDKATLKVKMLPKAVEQAYERMVTHRDDLMAQNPKRSEALAQDEAWDAVRKGMSPKELAGFPPRDGALDLAAWQQAEVRVKARNQQKKRDASTLEANLALLPEEQRIGPQPKGRGTGVSDASSTVSDVGGKIDTGASILGGIGGGIAGMVGNKQDKALRDQQGVTKDKEFTDHLPGAVDQGVGTAVVQGMRANKQLKTGQRQWKDQVLPESDATKAKTGIGQVTGILSGLISAVSSAFQMVDSIEKSWESKDPYEGLKAAKAGATGLNGLVSVAKNSANLAKLIDSGVAEGVKQVIPGLDIAASALGMARGVTDVATAGMRQRETDLSMFEARAGSTDKVNVMVYPLMKVSQVYTKHLEQTCWSLGVNIMNFSVSVAQVASAGGFGIPAAIKAATTVVDNLHKIAHYIASKILNLMAKKAEKESAVMHVEGGAEDELRRHPKMAVDGIIMKAAAGDPTALMFLGNYRIDGKPITADYVKRIKPKPVKPFDPKAKPDTETAQTSDDALLLKIRAVVLAGMDTNADPQSVFEDMKKKVKPVTGILGGIADAWTESGDLATQRNEQAKTGKLGANTKTDRGLGWRIQKMFSSSKRGKLQQKTNALRTGESLPAGVVCAVGDLELKDQASPPDIKKFTDALTVEAIEAELKRTPRRNSPEWIEFLREALRTKVMAAASSAGVVGS
jgi:uncharacterized protein DUF4157